MGLKKGMTNNPNGRPKGMRVVYSDKIKGIVAKHFLEAEEGKQTELEKILNELSMDTDNKMSMKDKISAAYDYFRLIAPQARDEGDIEDESRIKNALYDKFFNKDSKQ